MAAPFDGYVVDFDVRFADLDPLNHVNNVAYFAYMETTRIRFLSETLGDPKAAGMGTVVASARCDFRSPAFFGETIRVTMWVSRIGNSSWDYVYLLTERDSGRLVAEGHTVMVWIDPATGKGRPLPDKVRRPLEACQRTADETAG